MPDDFRSKILKLKWGDMTAIVWKDKSDVHMLTYIHNPLAECNYCDKSEICPEAKYCGGLQLPHGLS
jgi:hypothetical protein